MSTPNQTTEHQDIAEGFKAAFREHPAGIALITAQTPEGPVGLTASSVASVGINPPAVAFSVTRSTGSAGGILQAPSYLIHLLSDRNITVAKAFAQSGEERFTPDQGWSTLPTGEPYLADARVALRCRTINVVPIGASSLVLAEVLETYQGTPGKPMIYHNREFHTLSPIRTI